MTIFSPLLNYRGPPTWTCVVWGIFLMFYKQDLKQFSAIAAVEISSRRSQKARLENFQPEIFSAAPTAPWAIKVLWGERAADRVQLWQKTGSCVCLLCALSCNLCLNPVKIDVKSKWFRKHSVCRVRFALLKINNSIARHITPLVQSFF